MPFSFIVIRIVHVSEKATAPYSSTLAWNIPWTEEPGGLQSMLTWLSDFTFTFHFHALEKEMATHSSVLAWRIPGMGEPGGLPSMGSNRVGHYWSYLEAAEAFVRKWAWLAVNSAKECQWPDSCSPREEAEKLSSVIAKMNLMAQKGDQRSPFQKREKWRRIQITVGR